MQLGVDVSEGCVEDDADGCRGEGTAVGVEFDGHGGGGRGVVVGGWGEVAAGVSVGLAAGA